MTDAPPLSIEQIIELELDVANGHAANLLGARDALRARWNEGFQDIDTALRLAFLEWWSCSEPDFLTGMPDSTGQTTLFFDVFDQLSAAERGRQLVRFCMGWMTKEFPECCGDDRDWELVGEEIWNDYLTGEPIRPEAFSGADEFSQYFTHILRGNPVRVPGH